MKKTTFLIIVLLTLFSVGCGYSTENSVNSDSFESEGPVLNNIPSGKYELFSILNAVYKANPNAFDNQVKEKEFNDMLIATLNNSARRNPNLYTEFPATFYTHFAEELENGSFVVYFDYTLTNSDYPEMDDYYQIKYRIYTVMSRETYSKMRKGRYKIKGKYKGLLENSKLKDIYEIKVALSVAGFLELVIPSKNNHKLWANLDYLYYDDVSFEFIGDL